MSEILGHDCNGKPLRAGDRVELGPAAISVRPHGPGPWRIKGPYTESVFESVELDELLSNGMPLNAACEALRRIDDQTDHQPADAEFTEWLRGLGAETPASTGERR